MLVACIAASSVAIVLAAVRWNRHGYRALARTIVVRAVWIAELLLEILLPVPRVRFPPRHVPQQGRPARFVLLNARGPHCCRRTVNALVVVEVRVACRSCSSGRRRFDCAAAMKPTVMLRPDGQGHLGGSSNPFSRLMESQTRSMLGVAAEGDVDAEQAAVGFALAPHGIFFYWVALVYLASASRLNAQQPFCRFNGFTLRRRADCLACELSQYGR